MICTFTAHRTEALTYRVDQDSRFFIQQDRNSWSFYFRNPDGRIEKLSEDFNGARLTKRINEFMNKYLESGD